VARQGGRTLVVAGDAGGALYCLELVEPVGADKGVITAYVAEEESGDADAE